MHASMINNSLIDSLPQLDWEDALPDRDFDLAERHADLCEQPRALALCTAAWQCFLFFFYLYFSGSICLCTKMILGAVARAPFVRSGLGTSMQMTPARDWPCQASRMVIVNLQPTIKARHSRQGAQGGCRQAAQPPPPSPRLSSTPPPRRPSSSSSLSAATAAAAAAAAAVRDRTARRLW